ncbi:MAG: ketoacyl-ACP synthase III [Puniceicoccales bacterium]|jgi:3-oxoacyl-[acyl-carrier-protein] synthase-3|nr:ketoacyl-ACP synthase III [Puniceicoccales bacterium]
MRSPTPSVFIQGIGAYKPERRLTNDDLSRIVDTSDEWIRTRSGIRERRIAALGESNADLGAAAAAAAIQDAGISREDIDLLIVATVSAEGPVPSTACQIQQKLGLRSGIPAFDIAAACSGFVYLLQIASHMLRAGDYRSALIVATEKLSGITDWQDRATCVLFGDGAGAAVVAKCDEPYVGILGNVLGADGTRGDLLTVSPRTGPKPASVADLPVGTHVIGMNGREIFRNAVRVMSQACRGVLEKCNVPASRLSLIIPHQANLRIIDAIASDLELPLQCFKLNLERVGNTSAASIPLALEEAYREGQIKVGDYILLVAFGGGFTWGATLIKWYQPKTS